MSETKFTKAPWSIYGDWGIKDENGKLIAQFEDLASDLDLSNSDESWANGHLIAAAPEMYDLLESLSSYDECQMHKEEINELLAKARGE